MSNDSDQRIRQVAIVLQSLDAATSRGLLAQLPPAQARLIRHAMVNLGAVTAHERADAMESMQGLLKQGQSKSRAKPGRQFADSSESPAAELLANANNADGIDQVILSNAAYDPPAENPVPNSGPLPSWYHLPNEVLAEILQSERPMLIATVLNHLPVERATEIIQSLPIQLAGATLSAVPQVRLTDTAILKDIEAEIERKVAKFQPQRQLSEEGLSRLQAILAGLPSSQMDIWSNALSQSNPVLARQLGLSATPRSESFSKIDGAKTSHTQADSETPDFIDDLVSKTRTDTLSKFDQEPTVKEHDSATRTNVKIQSGNSAPLASITVPEDEVATPKTSESDAANFQSPLDSLEQLSDRDFVTVLHACSPHTVLLAISGANKQFVSRVERLIPPRDIHRLRKKLTELGTRNLKEIDTAQQAIANTANKFIAIGKIGRLQNVTFTAAA